MPKVGGSRSRKWVMHPKKKRFGAIDSLVKMEGVADAASARKRIKRGFGAGCFHFPGHHPLYQPRYERENPTMLA